MTMCMMCMYFTFSLHVVRGACTRVCVRCVGCQCKIAIGGE